LHRLWPAVQPAFAALQRSEQPEQDGEPAEAPWPETVIERLVPGWRLPEPPPRVAGRGVPDDPAEDLDQLAPPPLDYLWAGTSARHVGTVVHRALQRMAELGEAAQQPAWIARRRAHHRAELIRLGLSRAEAEQAAARVEQALLAALADERGRWVLGAHAQSQCELALTTWEGGRAVELILDRTFVDEQGVRWIVDYKTGAREGGAAGEFLDAERERYREQLERYARTFARLPGHPSGARIMLGLYFPLMQGWREWEAPR
jgi:ATP-dependent exoDNAse (exonuclease V) beta subunit